jgi:hypothetical protein
MKNINIIRTLGIALVLIVFACGCGKKSGDDTIVELKGGIKGGGVYVSK